MANYWKQEGIPHKGWVLIDVIDAKHEGEDESDTDYESCMMCGNEKIRYVHIVKHAEIKDLFRVGCHCAEKMTNDYINPGEREKDLRNRTNRRLTWIKKEWKRSKNNNYFLNIDDHLILIFHDQRTKLYKVKIGQIFGKKSFDTLEKAKIAAFNGMEFLKEKGEW